MKIEKTEHFESLYYRVKLEYCNGNRLNVALYDRVFDGANEVTAYDDFKTVDHIRKFVVERFIENLKVSSGIFDELFDGVKSNEDAIFFERFNDGLLVDSQVVYLGPENSGDNLAGKIVDAINSLGTEYVGEEIF